MSVLARLRELDANATPGPWEAHRTPYADTEHAELITAGARTRALQYRDGSLDIPDAELIAEARNALPLLLNIAEVAEEAAGYSRPTESVMRRLRHAVAALENQENT